MLERLVLRPELGAFEAMLRDRIDRLAALEDERLARPRTIERDSTALVVVTEFVPGSRLSDLLETSADPVMSPASTRRWDSCSTCCRRSVACTPARVRARHHHAVAHRPHPRRTDRAARRHLRRRADAPPLRPPQALDGLRRRDRPTAPPRLHAGPTSRRRRSPPSCWCSAVHSGRRISRRLAGRRPRSRRRRADPRHAAFRGRLPGLPRARAAADAGPIHVDRRRPVRRAAARERARCAVCRRALVDFIEQMESPGSRNAAESDDLADEIGEFGLDEAIRTCRDRREEQDLDAHAEAELDIDRLSRATPTSGRHHRHRGPTASGGEEAVDWIAAAAESTRDEAERLRTLLHPSRLAGCLEPARSLQQRRRSPPARRRQSNPAEEPAPAPEANVELAPAGDRLRKRRRARARSGRRRHSSDRAEPEGRAPSGDAEPPPACRGSFPPRQTRDTVGPRRKDKLRSARNTSPVMTQAPPSSARLASAAPPSQRQCSHASSSSGWSRRAMPQRSSQRSWPRHRRRRSFVPIPDDPRRRGCRQRRTSRPRRRYPSTHHRRCRRAVCRAPVSNRHSREPSARSRRAMTRLPRGHRTRRSTPPAPFRAQPIARSSSKTPARGRAQRAATRLSTSIRRPLQPSASRAATPFRGNWRRPPR